MKDKQKTILGVSVERQYEASKISSEVYNVCDYIADELVKIWELWDLEKSDTYFCYISSDSRITFMQRGNMGDRASEAEWLFKHKTIWIHDVVSLTRDNIADPETFLSKHREYRQKYDKYLHKLKVETDSREKKEREEEFEKLKKEFEPKEK